MNEKALYWSGRGPGLTDFLRHTYEKAMADVRALDQDKFNQKTDEVLRDEIYHKYLVEAPVFDREKVKVEVKEEDIPARMHPNHFLFADDDTPSHVKAHVAHVYVPFEGEAVVINYTPSSYSSVLPRGEVSGKAVFAIFVLSKADSAELDKKVDEHLNTLLPAAERAKKDADNHNSQLYNDLLPAIQERRAKVISDTDGLSGSKYLWTYNEWLLKHYCLNRVVPGMEVDYVVDLRLL